MKFLLVVCFVALGAAIEVAGQSCNAPKFQLDEETMKTLTRMVSVGLLNGYKQQVLSNNINTGTDRETRATLFPPQNETLELDDLAVSFPEDLDLMDLLVGTLNYTDVVVEGADQIPHDLTVNIIAIPAVIKFELAAPSIALTGFHETNLNVLMSQYNLTGEDDFELHISDLTALLEVKILANLITNKISIREFVIDLGFKDFGIDFGVTTVNDELINWETVSAEINSCFNEFWPKIKEALTTFVMEDINDIIKECTITDLAEGNFDCLFLTPATEPSTTPTAGGEETTKPGENGAVSKNVPMFSLFVALPLMYLIA